MPHLLLVDDDDLFRESLGLNLIDEGYEVTSFANGRDVLAYLDQGGGADVMLLDWRMPNLTGLDVLRQIRAAGTTIPVIFLTALSTSPGRQGRIPSQPELIGLDQSGAMRLLGPATEKSDEPPATVWRYKTASCELDLFFYLDLRSGRMRTLHYSFKGDGAEVARRQECLRSLFASRGG